MDVFIADDTQYATTFSDREFRRISVGMTESEVRSLLGDPFDRWAVDGDQTVTAWRWTRSPLDSHYKVRVVVFKDGRVFEQRAAAISSNEV